MAAFDRSSTAPAFSARSVPVVQAPMVSAAACRHLWLCIGLPQLSLEVLDVSDSQQPVAVVDGQSNQTKVCALNPMARSQGVRRGLSLNAAYAMCPQLQVVPRDQELEQKRLRQLAHWANGFTPWVSIEKPAALLLEVRGSLALFGGAQKLLERVEQGLGHCGHQHCLALAPTPLASLWLARGNRHAVVMQPEALAAQLGCLSVGCLGWPHSLVNTLAGMGVRSVRDCLRLPRAGFARRFGKQRLQQLDRALGRSADPRDAFIAPPGFKQKLEMPAETEDLAQLVSAVSVLTKQLGQFLIRRQATVDKLLLRLFHLDHPVSCLDAGMLEASCDAARFSGLLQVRLESTELPAPVVAVELSTGVSSKAVAREQDLFCKSGTTDWSVLLENLRTKLGVQAIFGVATLDEHRPELAWQRVQMPGTTMAAQADRVSQQRPVWLLEQSEPLTARRGWPCMQAQALVLEKGPERIESGWWDGSDVARDYYVASDQSGGRFWVYRERREPHRWFLHGIFG